ncbi:3-dehydroquinate synthase [Candidatus Magnetoovum chiemensis]|nr:3-dehydroquinate synthase [Candidatus Magnetoovum chiemensis]
MKKVWIEIDKWDKSLVTDALENGADALFVTNDEYGDKIKNLAKIDVYNKSALPENISFVRIAQKTDEEEAAKLPVSTSLIIETSDWKVIPLENLIAQRGNLFACVNNLDAAYEALGILEKGADGIYIKDCPKDEKINILKKVKSLKEKIVITEGEVVGITKLTIGDRVCIDTITNMKDGEGMLVGDYSNGMVLVNSESVENPYVSPRPFRVNAGAVHCYIMAPQGKTKYLSDLKSCDEVLIVNHKGETFTSVIGRIKQERRPMLKLEVKGIFKIFSVILQNAETIRIVTPDGKSKSIVSLVKGDKVAIYEEAGGRHFGHKITETIEEK